MPKLNRCCMQLKNHQRVTRTGMKRSHLFFRRQTRDSHVGAANRLDLLYVLETILTQQL